MDGPVTKVPACINIVHAVSIGWDSALLTIAVMEGGVAAPFRSMAAYTVKYWIAESVEFPGHLSIAASNTGFTV